MTDKPKRRDPIEIVSGVIFELLPERLQKNDRFLNDLGMVCGCIAGWIVGTKVAQWLLPGDRRDDK